MFLVLGILVQLEKESCEEDYLEIVVSFVALPLVEQCLHKLVHHLQGHPGLTRGRRGVTQIVITYSS